MHFLKTKGINRPNPLRHNALRDADGALCTKSTQVLCPGTERQIKIFGADKMEVRKAADQEMLRLWGHQDMDPVPPTAWWGDPSAYNFV